MIQRWQLKNRAVAHKSLMCLKCVVVWPLLYLIDMGLAWSAAREFGAARAFSRAEIRRAWSK